MKRALIFNDLHFPHIDVPLWDLLCEFCAWLKPDIRVWNGDIFDMYQISKFSHDIARRGKMAEERDQSFEYIKQMRHIRKSKTLDIAMPGNHEWRLVEWQRKHANVLDEVGLECPSWSEFLGLDDIGFDVRDFEDSSYPILELGLLKIFHGERTNKHAVVNVANDWGCSVMYGHTHRMRSFFKTTYDTTHAVWENGYLASDRLQQTYVKGIADWQQGFSVVTFEDKSGWFHVEQIPVCRVTHRPAKRFLYGGKIWECQA